MSITGDPDWTETVEFFCPSCDQFRDGEVRGYGGQAFWTCGECGQIVDATSEVK